MNEFYQSEMKILVKCIGPKENLEMRKKSLIIKGKKFISAKQAAEMTAYTSDYVGQLCRGQKVEAIRVGKSWYISSESILSHKAENLDWRGGEKAPKGHKVKRVEKPAIFHPEPLKRRDQDISVFNTDKVSSKNTVPRPIFTESSFSGAGPDLIPRIGDDWSSSDLNHLRRAEIENEIGLVASNLLPAVRKSKTEALRTRTSDFFNKTSKIPGELWNKYTETLEKGAFVWLAVALVFGNFFFGKFLIADGGYEKLSGRFSQVASITGQKLADFDFADVASSFKKTADFLVSVPEKAPALASSGLNAFSDWTKSFFDSGERFSYRASNLIAKEFLNLEEKARSITLSESRAIATLPVEIAEEAARSVNHTIDTGVFKAVDGVISIKNRGIDFFASLFGGNGAVLEKQIIVREGGPSVVVRTSVPQVSKPLAVSGAVDRIIMERVVSGVTSDDLETRLNQLENKLMSQMYKITADIKGNATYISNVHNIVSQTNRIDMLTSVDITDSTWTSGSISSDNISGTFRGNIETDNFTLNGVGADMIITTNGSRRLVASSTPQVASINATSTNATSTFAGGLTLGTNGFVFDFSSTNVGIGTTSPLSKLDLHGNLILSGSGRYINFGDAVGSIGYGIRDSSGTLEFKNSGGGWTGFGTGSGGGFGQTFELLTSNGIQALTPTTSVAVSLPGTTLYLGTGLATSTLTSSAGKLGLGSSSPFAVFSISP
ncbi:MAG: hypothetical protein UX94_C0004G0052, partial [Parcubacteria group bacterium GW2011_GWA2_47_21]